MKKSLTDRLHSLSKDEDSFKELSSMFQGLIDERNQHQKKLNMLERVIENDYDSIMITSLELEKPGPKIVYVNQGFCNITGYTREEVIGKTPRLMQGSKTDRKTLDRLKNRLKAGRAFFGQTVNYRKDGSEFINQWDIHPLMDEEGNPAYWVSYMHDITERKRAEKTVINTHASFDNLRKHSKSTLLTIDTDGRIISANKSFRNLTGYHKDELHNRNIWELFPRKYRNSLKTRFDKKFRKSDFANLKLKGIIKHKKGLPIQVKCVLNVLELQEGTIIRAEIRNISLQKRIMETLERRNEEYTKIVDKVSEFNYRMNIENGHPVIDYLSENFEEVTGIPAEVILDSGDWERIVHDDDVQKVQSYFSGVMKGKAHTCEYRVISKNGSYRTVIDNAKPGICKKDGEEHCVRGSIVLLPETAVA